MDLSPHSSHSHFRRDKIEKKRQRTQGGPNQNWFDAIMSKSRAIDNIDASNQHSEHNGHRYDSAMYGYVQGKRVSNRHHDGYDGHIDSTPSSSIPYSTSDFMTYQQQLTVDPIVLHLAMAKALQNVVHKQRCCLIASGICHLCDPGEHQMVPVVNFCPISKTNHSLCGKHLQSIHRFRIEDVFLPTEPPIYLKCSICSLSCPCPNCHLERETHFEEYTQWLRQDKSPSTTRSPHNHTTSLSNSAIPKHLRDHNGPAERIDMAPVLVPPTMTPTPPPHENEMEDAEHLSMSSEPKQPMRPRSLKRAAKEVRSSDPVVTSNTRPKRSATPTIETTSETEAAEKVSLPSPSAVSVLNCPDSEQSLVRLLSSLNQEVTPAIQYFANDLADSKGPSDQNGKGEEEKERENDSIAKQRAKREISKGNDSNISKKSTGETSLPPRGVNKSRAMTLEDSTYPSFRKRAPPPVAVEKKNKLDSPPSSSPRISSNNARGKSTASVAAETTKETSKKTRGRKRKNESVKSPQTSIVRNSGKRGRKPAMTATIDKKTSEPDSDEEMKDQMVAEGALEDEESDLDANLDYCEVCLSAGDLVCCDICPRSFHLSCLKMTESDLPLGDWQCVECKKPSYFEGFAVRVKEKTTVKAKCLQIIECLQLHPFAKPFLSPVEDVPLYSNVVKNPMDLSTIERKLKQREYAAESSDKSVSSSIVGSVPTVLLMNAQGINLISFAEDVRLVWSNCKLFNDDGSGITRAADELAIGFETLYRDVVEFVAKKNGGLATGVVNGADAKTKQLSLSKGSISPSPATSTAVSSNPSPTEVPTQGSLKQQSSVDV